MREFYRQLFKAWFLYEANAGDADGYVGGRMVVELKGWHDDWLPGLLSGAALGQKGAGLCLHHCAGRQFYRVEFLALLAPLKLAHGRPYGWKCSPGAPPPPAKYW